MARWGEGQEGANKAGRKGAFGGRMQALQCLDKMLARRKTQATLMRALDEEFKENPIGFFRTIIMPLLPKEAKLTVDHDGVLEWKSMLGPIAPVTEVPSPATIDVPAVESGRGEA
jgi:hypothetical protein